MEAQDRRAVRTRRWLRSAFLELVLQKPYEAITIQDITDRADTARVTFYRHYKDKEELLLDCLEGLYCELSQHLEEMSIERASDPNEPVPILMLYQYLDANFQLYRTLLTGPVAALVNRRLRQYIAQAVVATIAKNAMPESLVVPTDVLANQLAASFMGMIVWWLENDRPYPMDYLAKVSHWYALMGVTGALNLPVELTPPDLRYSNAVTP